MKTGKFIIKRIFCFIILFFCYAVITSCGMKSNLGNADLSNNKPNDTSKKEPSSIPNKTQSNESIPNCTPTSIPNVVESIPSKSPTQESYYGKWKITEMVGYGYIYGEFSIDDYVNGIITINESYFEYDIPLEKKRLRNPKYKVKTQSKNEFYHVSNANFDNGFGFKGDKVKLVMVYDGNDKWHEFGATFWIRDKNHLIVMGPVYFLAERVE